MNSSKQSSPTIKKYFDPRGTPYGNMSKPTIISDGVELIKERHNHGELCGHLTVLLG